MKKRIKFTLDNFKKIVDSDEIKNHTKLYFIFQCLSKDAAPEVLEELNQIESIPYIIHNLCKELLEYCKQCEEPLAEIKSLCIRLLYNSSKLENLGRLEVSEYRELYNISKALHDAKDSSSTDANYLDVTASEFIPSWQWPQGDDSANESSPVLIGDIDSHFV